MSEKVVLITGASSGIGFDTARELANNGYIVYGTSRKPESDGYGFNMLELDITKDDSVKICVAKILDQEGRIDVLVNNAGYGVWGAVEEATSKEAKNIFKTNFFGTLRMIQEVLPTMRNQKSGLIINISSILGLMATPGSGLYCASKFALEGLSQSLRIEVAKFGIKVSVINPGFTNTKFAHNAVFSTATPEYKKLTDTNREIVEYGLGNAPEPDIVTEAIVEIIEEEYSEHNYIVGEDSAKMLDLWNELPPEELATRFAKKFGCD